MQATILGSGSPIPSLERAGTSIHLEIDGDEVLLDCGPGTVYRLIENDIDLGGIETLFFTHHHMDHNAAFKLQTSIVKRYLTRNVWLDLSHRPCADISSPSHDKATIDVWTMTGKIIYQV